MDPGGAQRWPRRVFAFFVEHWLVAGLIPPLPGLVGLALRLFDIEIGTLELVLGTVVIVLASAFSIAKAKAVNYEITVRNNNDYVLARLLKSTNGITRAKFERFASFVRKEKCPLPAHPFEQITRPEVQLRCILEHLQRALVDVHGMDIDQVGVSLACDVGDGWGWLVRINSEDDLELDALANDSRTGFHHVMVARDRGFLFHADKRTGIREKSYVASTRDGEASIGSIIVHRLELPVDGAVFSAALSISTYGKQLCEEADLEAKEKIRTTLLPCFESRLRLELCLYYIKYVMVPRSPSLVPSSTPSAPPAPVLSH